MSDDLPDNVIKFPVKHLNDLTHDEKIQYHLFRAIELMCEIEHDEIDMNHETAVANAKSAVWFFQHSINEL